MSHIVTIKTEIRDAAGVEAACQRLKLPPPVEGTHKLFSSRATGLAVQLTKWRYPVVCELPTGQIHYDDYGGRWGEQTQLDAFLQAYAVEKAKIECRRRGHGVVERSLSDGSIKLTVQVAGGAV
ncbi:MAG: DUF1257 domain-containing protein [Pirellulaceae bacterium]